MTDQELRNVLEYFGQEQACYTALLDLSRRQHNRIDKGDLAAVEAILEAKQRFLLQVEKVEKKLRPYKQNWDRLRDTLDDNDRQVLDLALSTVEELLRELIASEKQCERLLDRA